MFRDRVVVAEMESSTLTQGEVREVTSFASLYPSGLALLSVTVAAPGVYEPSRRWPVAVWRGPAYDTT